MAQVLTDKRGQRFVDTVFSNGQNRLCVSADLVVEDIEIGKVEIKNATDDTTANVIPIGTQNALAITDLVFQQKSTVMLFGATNIPIGSETTLVSYTVPAGKVFYFEQYIIGGNNDGELSAYVNGTKVSLVRNSAAARTQYVTFKNAIVLSAGNLVEIKAKNRGLPAPSANKQFEANLNGFTLPA